MASVFLIGYYHFLDAGARILHSQLAWFVGGPLLGLCVVAMRWLMNERLGVMGAWTDVVHTVAARRLSFGPFGWMLLGLVAGAAGFALVAGGPDFHGYGWLTDTFTGTGGTLAIVAILFACGLLIGLGTKIAGGCTSGNGLSGNAMASPASLVATMTFFATGIAVTRITEALI
jgi:uncharacterized membrane protein YedE/YeeE